jgi:hypothetical protein
MTPPPTDEEILRALELHDPEIVDLFKKVMQKNAKPDYSPIFNTSKIP